MSERSGGAQEDQEGRKRRDVPPRGKKKQFEGFVQEKVKREGDPRPQKKKKDEEVQGSKRKESLDKPQKEREAEQEQEIGENGRESTQQKQPRQKRKKKPESEPDHNESRIRLVPLEQKIEAGPSNHELHRLLPTAAAQEHKVPTPSGGQRLPNHLRVQRDRADDSTEDDEEVDASLDPAYSVVPMPPTDAQLAAAAAAAAAKAKRPKFPIGHDKAAPEPTTISAARRIKQFPNQGLRPHPEEECLYCEICCTSVSRIKQRIRTHLQTFKHRQGMGGKICREQVPPDEGLYVDPAARMQAFSAMMTASASSPPEQLYGDLRGLRRIIDGGHYFQPRSGRRKGK